MGVLGGELSNINGYEHVVEKSQEEKADKLIKEERDKQAFRKYDQGKLRYDLMPAKTFEQIVDVLTYGANKYTTKDSDGANNWHKCPDPDTRYYAAALRHLQAFRMGEFYDKESGKPHLAHALCCLIFILEYHNMHNTTDPYYITTKDEKEVCEKCDRYYKDLLTLEKCQNLEAHHKCRVHFNDDGTRKEK